METLQESQLIQCIQCISEAAQSHFVILNMTNDEL